MTVRTLLRLGKSSLVVVLPKDWLKENNLKSGDKILIKQDSDGSLRLIPMDSRNNLKKRVLYVNVDRCGDADLVQRIIVANYLVGNTELIITTRKDTIHPTYMRAVREITAKLKDLDIIERRANFIVLQSDSIEVKYSIGAIIRHILTIILAMVDFLREALMKRDPALLEKIIVRENEVDRWHWLGIRQLILVMKNRAFAKSFGISSMTHAIDNRVIIKALEISGDYLEEIAKDLQKIGLDSLDEAGEVISEVTDLIDNIENALSDVNRALEGVDATLANQLIKYVGKLEERIHELEEKIIANVSNPKLNYAFTKMLTRLSDMLRNIAVICEVIINRALESPNKSLKNCVQEF